MYFEILAVKNIKLFIHIVLIVSWLGQLSSASAVDRGFESPTGLTKEHKISICCFCAKHTAFRRQYKYWLARNQNNVSAWGNMLIRGLFFQ